MQTYTVNLTVEAQQLNPSTCNAEQMAMWCGGVAEQVPGTPDMRTRVLSPNGEQIASPGDWVIRMGGIFLVLRDVDFQRLFNPPPPAVDATYTEVKPVDSETAEAYPTLGAADPNAPQPEPVKY